MTDVRSPVQNTITFKNSQGDRARGTLMKLTRTSIVMEVYNPYSIVQLSEVLEEVTIYRGPQTIYSGKGVVSNLVNTGLMLIVSATLVDNWENLTELDEEQTLGMEAEKFVSGWSNAQQLYSGYQLIVGKLRSFLYELNLWMDQIGLIEDNGDTQSEESRKQLEQLVQPILPKIQEMFTEFEMEAKEIKDEELMTHKLYAQHDLHPLLMRSPFVHRTFTKPLGYAGDYEMVNMMLRDGWEGPTGYAKIVNYFHILRGPAEAHRNRISILVQKLEELAKKGAESGKRLKVLNIACGPAAEIQTLVEKSELSEFLEFTLLDFNDLTLGYTRQKLKDISEKSKRDLNVNYIQASVHELLKSVHLEKLELGEDEHDMVYCAGLFDYLSDRVCTRLLRLFYRLIKPQGRVLVTNVDPSNSSTYLMEHLLEWYLIYRDQDHLSRMVKGLGEQVTYADETGMNVFLEILKPETLND